MSLWRIAWRSVRQRGVASALTIFSMALGVMLVVCVLSIHGIVAQSFRSNSNLGFNILVGAKGGSLQLTLNSVYYLSSPVENIPYDFYLEFVSAQEREAAYNNSLYKRAQESEYETHGATTTGDAKTGAGSSGPEPDSHSGEEQHGESPHYRELLGDAARVAGPLDYERDGRFSQFTQFAIPLCLGDYVGRFRVVGTTAEFFDKLKFGEEGERSYEFADGRCFQYCSKEYGFFEAVVGATAARELDLKVGQGLSPTHGDPEMGGRAHKHQFHVVGILKPTGTPNDRAVFVNMEGFFLMADHAKPLHQPEGLLDTGLDDAEHDEHDEHGEHAGEPLPIEEREVTAVLVRTKSAMVAGGIQTAINEGAVAQAVLPVAEIYRLFDTFVTPVQRILLVLTVMICIVSGISILVSIYNSMSDRRHEIAVMRALGASRNTVMTVILLEAVFLAMVGGAVGWAFGHGLNVLASSRVEQQTGVAIGFFDVAPSVNIAELLGADSGSGWLGQLRVSSELLLIPGLILLAILVGFFPALTAYRTDVGASLEK